MNRSQTKLEAMMEDIKDTGVQETAEVKQAAEVLEPKQEVKTVELPKQEEVKRVPLAELQKERQRRRIAEEEMGRIRQEIEEIKANQSRYSVQKDEDDLVEEAEKSLGIEREAARKLIGITKKAAERVLPKHQAPQQSEAIIVAQTMERFKQRAIEVSADYEDWDQMIPSMQAIMAKELQDNGIAAYQKSPEYYYSKAVKAQKSSEAKVKQESQIESDNASNLSTAEAGGGSRRSAPTKITQAVFDANRRDPKWIRANREEINNLVSQGKLR